MNIIEAIAVLDKAIPNPNIGLNKEIFEYISRTTPLINVDLLIKDEKNRTLLAWRDDKYAKQGWHIPGRIVRYRETLEDDVKMCAEIEIGVPVEFNPNPIKITEFFHPDYNVRGHFVSLLYKCDLPSSFIPLNKGLTSKSVGYLKWHNSCPKNIIGFHEAYRNIIDVKWGKWCIDQ